MATQVAMHDVKALRSENGKVYREQRFILTRYIKSLMRIIESGDKGTRSYWEAVAELTMARKELRRINRVFSGI